MAAALEAISEYQLSGQFRSDGKITNTSEFLPVLYAQRWLNGTGVNRSNLFGATRLTAAGAPVNVDLEVFTTEHGDVLKFVRLREILIVNRSNVQGDTLEVKGNFITSRIISGTKIILGAGERFNQTSPIDGWGVTDVSSDTITLDPLANTVEFDLILIGTDAV